MIMVVLSCCCFRVVFCGHFGDSATAAQGGSMDNVKGGLSCQAIPNALQMTWNFEFLDLGGKSWFCDTLN